MTASSLPSSSGVGPSPAGSYLRPVVPGPSGGGRCVRRLTLQDAQVRTAWFTPPALLLLVKLLRSQSFKEAGFVTHTKLVVLRAGGLLGGCSGLSRC